MSAHESKQARGDIRFRGVEGFGSMANILSRMEHPEGKTIQKIAGRQQTRNGAKSPSSAF